MITRLNTAFEIATDAKAHKQRVALIHGCFDILHLGHLSLFSYAKKHCDILLVGLASDKTVEINKGVGRPIFNIKERLNTISKLGSVDAVFEIDTDLDYKKTSGKEFFYNMEGRMMPNVLVTAYEKDPYLSAKRKRTDFLGIKLLKYRVESKYSTSNIIQHIKNS